MYDTTCIFPLTYLSLETKRISAYHNNGDVSARKIAGNEMRGLRAFQRAATKTMHAEYANTGKLDGIVRLATIPTCLVDYCGLRFYAMCVAPIDGERTLSYGRRGPGHALLGSGAQPGDKRDDQVINALVAVEKALNLKPHLYQRPKVVSKRSRNKGEEEETQSTVSVHCSVDIQVHRCFDGRYYAMNMARLMPSDLPQPGTDEILTHVLRPELVVSNCDCGTTAVEASSPSTQSSTRKRVFNW